MERKDGRRTVRVSVLLSGPWTVRSTALTVPLAAAAVVRRIDRSVNVAVPPDVSCIRRTQAPKQTQCGASEGNHCHLQILE